MLGRVSLESIKERLAFLGQALSPVKLFLPSFSRSASGQIDREKDCFSHLLSCSLLLIRSRTFLSSALFQYCAFSGLSRRIKGCKLSTEYFYQWSDYGVRLRVNMGGGRGGETAAELRDSFQPVLCCAYNYEMIEGCREQGDWSKIR